jgi:esterase FrsA
MNVTAELLTAGAAATDEKYLSELKQLVLLHARAQNLSTTRCVQLLKRIRSDGAQQDDSWVNVWSAVAHDCEARGQHLQASAHYGTARFPYVDGVGRAQAHGHCVRTFSNWAQSRGVERMEVAGPEGRAALWIKRGPPGTTRVLLVFGGIVSIKEQWAGLLDLTNRLGVTVALTELPGVGENSFRYGLESWRWLSMTLDRLRDAFGIVDAHLLALSFGGHLAMRAALHDARVRSVITVGAPVASFFTDDNLWRKLPDTTVRTLAHIMGCSRDSTRQRLVPLALNAGELRELRIPIFYIASSRDEIIPRADWEMLRRYAPQVAVLEYDDVHGSPAHLVQMRLRILGTLLRLQDRHSFVQQLIFRGLDGALTLRRQLLGA